MSAESELPPEGDARRNADLSGLLPRLAGDALPPGLPIRRRRSPVLKVVEAVVFLAVLALVGRELVLRLGQLDGATLRVRWGVLAAATAAQSLVMIAWATAYHVTMRHLAHPPRARTTFAVAWVAQMGKYVPGKVGTVVAAVYLLRPHGVAAAAAIGTAVIQQALWGVLGLLAAVPLMLWPPIREAVPLAWVACAGLSLAVAAALHPRIFIPLSNWVLKRFGVRPMALVRGVGLYAAPGGVLAIDIALTGLTLWLVCRAVTPLELAWLPLAVSAAALAAVAGYVVLFAPSGLGIREGILLFLLTPVIGPAPAALAVIIARVIQTVVELAFAGVGLVILRRGGG